MARQPFLTPVSLLTAPLGSGPRLNVIRELIDLGLTPALISVSGVYEPYDHARLVDLTDGLRLRETIVRVYYHPHDLAAATGCHHSSWFRWADSVVKAFGNDAVLFPHMTPSPVIAPILRSRGILTGGRRARIRVLDFNLVAYILATRADTWGATTDIHTVNRLKRVLSRFGNIQVQEAAFKDSSLDIESLVGELPPAVLMTRKTPTYELPSSWLPPSPFPTTTAAIESAATPVTHVDRTHQSDASRPSKSFVPIPTGAVIADPPYPWTLDMEKMGYTRLVAPRLPETRPSEPPVTAASIEPEVSEEPEIPEVTGSPLDLVLDMYARGQAKLVNVLDTLPLDRERSLARLAMNQPFDGVDAAWKIARFLGINVDRSRLDLGPEFENVLDIDLSRVDDLQALENRVREERLRRERKAISDQLMTSTVDEVSFRDGTAEVSNLTVRLENGNLWVVTPS
jgi:hypothetical protein